MDILPFFLYIDYSNIMNHGLKDAWRHSFKVGAAISRKVLEQKENDEIIMRHFSSITAENAMKFQQIHPQENSWNWDEADFIVGYAKKNGLNLRGHTLLWHNQTPPWLFLDGNEPVSRNKLFERLEDHIAAVTQRYNDAVYAWDVLNEVIDTDKGDEANFRLSEWYKIGGREIFEFAFKRMRESCPNAKLFYNDYNNESGPKFEATLRFLSSLLDAGIPVDGVGIQGHWYYNSPDEKILRTAIERYSSLGLEIEFTEVDISAYKWDEARDESQFFSFMPEDRKKDQTKRYMELFTVASQYEAVKNITTWGVSDSYTWLDYFPVKNRKNWPLLFDEQYREKDFIPALIEAGLKQVKD
jgi:endo-1,4-beta-xylanase